MCDHFMPCLQSMVRSIEALVWPLCRSFYWCVTLFNPVTDNAGQWVVSFYAVNWNVCSIGEWIFDSVYYMHWAHASLHCPIHCILLQFCIGLQFIHWWSLQHHTFKKNLVFFHVNFLIFCSWILILQQWELFIQCINIFFLN